MTRRLTLSTCPGHARRRAMRLHRRLDRWPGAVTFVRGRAAERDARRLYEAGLVHVALSRDGWVSGREWCLSRDHDALRRTYPYTTLPRHRRHP